MMMAMMEAMIVTEEVKIIVMEKVLMMVTMVLVELMTVKIVIMFIFCLKAFPNYK